MVRFSSVVCVRACNNTGFTLQVFELATGDYLFEPHSGADYSRDEGMITCTSLHLVTYTYLYRPHCTHY